MHGPQRTQNILILWFSCAYIHSADLFKGRSCMSTFWTAQTNGVTNPVRGQTLNAWMCGLRVKLVEHQCSPCEPRTRVIARGEPSYVWGKTSKPMYSGSMDNIHPYQDTRNEHETHVFSNFQALFFFKVLSRTQENPLKNGIYLKKLIGV